MGYQYIASPYTHADPNVVQDRVQMAAFACARMLKQGGIPYSPIVHGHAIEKLIGNPISYDTWLNHGLEMLKKAQAFYILTLDGWQESRGVAVEKEVAIQFGIPVGYLNADAWCHDKEFALATYSPTKIEKV